MKNSKHSSIFHILMRDERYESIKLRVENLLNQYPNGNRVNLLKRLQSGDDNQFIGAYFELYLYNLLNEMGFEIEIEPEIQTTGKHPDFLIKKNGKDLFYLEATIAGYLANFEWYKNANRIIAYLNENLKVNYLIMAILVKIGNKTPKLKEICKLLESAKVNEKVLCENNDWMVEFTVTPTSISDQKAPKIMPILIKRDRSGKIIRKAIERKAKQGTKDLPYIVAVNTFMCNDQDIVDALYGKYAFQVNNGKIEKLEFKGSIDEGAFKQTKISGVLMFVNLLPWWNGAEPVLWLNPVAKNPIQQEILESLKFSYKYLEQTKIVNGP